eukprot:m.105744 g.105744  ORF g.105744 m.105744 type:complete len:654 (+) comp13889_c0_seq1:316-2277(+)
MANFEQGQQLQQEQLLCAESIALREEGNIHFKAKQFVKAIQLYGDALVAHMLKEKPQYENSTKIDPVFPQASCQCLPSIYLNRASALRKLNVCVQDAEADSRRACELRPQWCKALYRKAQCMIDTGIYSKETCEAALKQAEQVAETSGESRAISQGHKSLSNYIQKEQSCQTDLNDLDWMDDISEGFASTVEITRVTKDKESLYGRGVVALKDINPGDVILCENEALGSIVHEELFSRRRQTHCHQCYKAVPLSFVSCSFCNFAVYCGEACIRLAWRHHQYECKHPLLNRYHTLSHEQKQGAPEEASMVLDCILACRILRDGKRTHLQNLESHESDLPENLMKRLRDYVEICTQTSNLEDNFGIVGKSYKALASAADKQVLIRVVCQLRINGIANVGYHVRQAKGQPVGSQMEWATAYRRARALYGKMAMLNHSCIPNAIVSFHGSRLCVRATRAVTAGEEVNISYGSLAASEVTEQRRTSLAQQYFFICNCFACKQCIEPMKLGNNEEWKKALGLGQKAEDILDTALTNRDEILLKQSVAMLADALTIEATLPDPDCLEIARLHHQMAKTKFYLGELHASVHSKRSLDILRKCYGEQDICVGLEALVLASLFSSEGGLEQARQVASKGLLTVQHSFGSDHPQIIKALKKYLN